MAAATTPVWASTPLVAGDTQVTVSFTTANVTDVVYVKYRASGSVSWTTFGTTLTGSGSIIVTGLTNSIQYEFTLYCVDISDTYSGWADSKFGRPHSATFSADPVTEGIQNYWDTMIENTGQACTLKKITRTPLDKLNNRFSEVVVESSTHAHVSWKPNMRQLEALGVDTDSEKPLITNVRFADEIKKGDRLLFEIAFITELGEVEHEFEVTRVLLEDENILRQRVLITPLIELNKGRT